MNTGNKRTGEYEEVVVEPGVEDKRLLVLEAEFASVPRVLGREGSTLSAQIRQAWDSGDVRTMVKNSPARATGSHISMIGHVTRAELRRYCQECGAVLGDQRNGDLFPGPGVTVEKITRGGASTVRRPACGVERLWASRGRPAKGAPRHDDIGPHIAVRAASLVSRQP